MAVSDRIVIDAAVVRSRIDVLLRTYPELADDDGMLADALEGQTDLHEVASRILDAELTIIATSNAIRARRADLTDRQDRFERRGLGLRALLKTLLETAKLERLVLPEATISIAKGRETVVIADDEALPSQLCSIIRQPDKKAILDRLKKGEEIPGAILQRGDDTLSIRTK